MRPGFRPGSAPPVILARAQIQPLEQPLRFSGLFSGLEAVKESKFSEGERLAGLMCLDSSRGSMSKHIKV